MALRHTAYYETASVVRGYQVYKDIWTPVIGEQLLCQKEEGNPNDRCAVSVLHLSTVVGHVLRHMSTLCYIFIQRGGSISCIITGMYQYSRDLPQRGMDVPCKYRFTGNPEELHKVERHLQGGDEKQRHLPSDDTARCQYWHQLHHPMKRSHWEQLVCCPHPLMMSQVIYKQSHSLRR